MTEARYETASRHALAISAAADALSTAIYEARRDGYDTKIAVRNVILLSNNDGRVVLIGGGVAVGIKATIPFDIGDSGL